jgi:hypothetical protein
VAIADAGDSVLVEANDPTEAHVLRVSKADGTFSEIRPDVHWDTIDVPPSSASFVADGDDVLAWILDSSHVVRLARVGPSGAPVALPFSNALFDSTGKHAAFPLPYGAPAGSTTTLTAIGVSTTDGARPIACSGARTGSIYPSAIVSDASGTYVTWAEEDGVALTIGVVDAR